MDPPASRRSSPSETSPIAERLDSWKEIAAYLNRSVRTVHRWEKEEGLPVHRQLHKDLGSVFAYRSELDAWSTARSVHSESRLEADERASATPRRTIVATAVAAVALMGALAYLVQRNSRPATSGRDFQVAGLELISTFAGSHRWPALSPDGRMVAFVSDAGGTPQIWIKNLAAGDPVQITFGQLAAFRPRWSGPGNRIIYSRRGAGIWSVPSLGGESRQVVEDGWNADVSPDGRQLVFERSGRIVMAGADGVGESLLPHPPLRLIEHYGESWPTFSPDGRFVAVFLGEQGRYGDYWVLPSDGKDPRRVTSDLQEGSAPAWTPDGKSLVVASARSGSVNLWRVSIAGGPPESLTTGTGEDIDPVVSSDGRTLLFANVKRTWALIAQDVRSGRQRTLLETRTALAFPRYSPDGSRIALMERNSRGETQLAIVGADGSGATTVTNGAGELNIMPQWSGDGQSLYFYQVRPSVTFRRLSITGGASREVAPWSFQRQYQAAVDPRERDVVYSSVESGTLQQSRVLALQTGAERALPFALFEHRFSRDGRWIAGESPDHEVIVCRRDGGQCRTLTPKHDHALTTLTWSGDGRWLFFLRHTSERVWGELTSVGIDGGAVRAHGLVGPFERDFQMSIDASPRDEVVYTTCREGPHELWMARLR